MYHRVVNLQLQRSQLQPKYRNALESLPAATSQSFAAQERETRSSSFLSAATSQGAAGSSTQRHTSSTVQLRPLASHGWDESRVCAYAPATMPAPNRSDIDASTATATAEATVAVQRFSEQVEQTLKKGRQRIADLLLFQFEQRQRLAAQIQCHKERIEALSLKLRHLKELRKRTHRKKRKTSTKQRTLILEKVVEQRDDDTEEDDIFSAFF